LALIPGGIPSKEVELVGQVREWVEQCRVSVPMRKSYYRLLNAIAETGKYDGTKSLINMMQPALTQVAAHIFSPVELKFAMDFERPYPKETYNRAAEVAKQVTRTWDRNGTDNTFGRGVFESLKYGAAFMKQWVTFDADQMPVYHDKLVMPWNFGVYREDRVQLDEQPILIETSTLTLPEVWQRIWRFPSAEKLFKKIQSHTAPGEAGQEPNSFFHQVLSTSQLNTGVQGMTSPVPGGIVQLNSDPNYALMGPVIAPDVVQMHELWVQDEDDYTTIQMIEPDIIITPLTIGNVVMKKQNLLAKGSRLQPYRIIQPNEVTDWIWGRSELTDIIEPQQLLGQWCEDAKRLIGVEIDKFLGFIGETGMTDELYAQARMAGYVNMAQGSSISDLTPHMPGELLPTMKWLIEMINVIRGFPPIMQGQGEPGVRAGSHANTLMKTASPTLRDRALLTERQCAACADLTATLKELKDESFYWTKADNPTQDIEQTKFLISDLPSDWRITVDSHSSSPIFSDENTQLVFAAQAKGIVDGAYVIDNTPLPNRESAKQSFRDMQAAKQKQMQDLLHTDPEAAHKAVAKSLTGGGHH
jgi:hypothetical protein